jgi:PAS domain S-box-containing protein
MPFDLRELQERAREVLRRVFGPPAKAPAVSAAPEAPEERFRALVDELDTIFWEASAETLQFTFMSRGAEALLGYPVGRWLREPDFWVNLIHPDDRTETVARCRAAAREGLDCEFEYRVIAANGRIVWLRDIVHVVRDPAGGVHLQGVMLDVTSRKSAEQQRTVRHDVTQILAEATSLGEAAPRLLRAIGEGLDWEWGALWCVDAQVDPHHRVLRCTDTWHLPSVTARELTAISQHATCPPGIGLPGRVWEAARPLWMVDATKDARAPWAAAAAREGFHAALGFPLAHGSEVFGVMEFVTRKILQPDDDLLEMVATIGSQIEQFVDRAQVYERAHRIAETLQRAFLPASLPELPGVRFCAAYLPGAVESEVGGDWYDVFRLPDGRVALSVGDVVGHGLQAAVIMGQVRQSIRAAALEGHRPPLVLTRASSVLRLTYEIEGMATAVFGIFDPVSLTFTYATAGHPAPALAAPDGRVEMLPSGGLPLGAQSFQPSSGQTVSLPLGSLLVLYTDGLVEATKDVVAGEAALIAALQAELAEGPEDAARAVLDRMLAGGRPTDDVAILTVALDPTPVDQFDLTIPAAPAALPVVRQALRQVTRTVGLDEDRAMALQVAVGEAMNNVIEHAYGAASGMVHVRVRRDGNALIVHVEDHGSWRPPRAEGRGHGLALMRGLVDAVEIDSTPSGTTVRLRILLEASTGVTGA